jgi:hypothetical protein
MALEKEGGDEAADEAFLTLHQFLVVVHHAKLSVTPTQTWQSLAELDFWHSLHQNYTLL